MANKLKDKVAVVTGASKGIGASIALHLATEGANVAVNYSSSREGADRVVEQIKKQGGKAIAVKANLTNPADIKNLFAETLKAFGKLDILINNAGIYEFSPIEQITADFYRKTFDINVLAVLLAIQEAVNHFGEEGGSIVNISSIVSTLALPNAAVYSASKGAIDAITRSLGTELGKRKIRVNAVNPGMVITEGSISAGISESEFRKETELHTPLGRIGQPEDVAKAVLFFASPDSSWITGECLIISGGTR